MPLDTSAIQTTATNSATYLVNSRRRVFATGAVAGACGGASAAAAAPGRVEARKYLAKSRALMANTGSNVGPPCPPSPRDAAPSFDHLVCPCEHIGGTVSPSVLAVFRLITSSNLVGACRGRSPGLAPFKIRST